MLEVIRCERRGHFRSFFSLSGMAGYWKEEARFLKTYARPAMNALCANGPTAYFLAFRDGKPVFRAFTGIDFMYQQNTGEKNGYFSLFDGEADPDAARAVLERIIRFQKEAGSEGLIGPVSPDGGGFFHGLSDAEKDDVDRGILTGPASAWKIRLLTEEGFQPIERDFAYEVTLSEENPYQKAADLASARFGISVVKLQKGIFRENWRRMTAEALFDHAEHDSYRMLERIGPFLSERHSFLAVRKGACVGCLLSLTRGEGDVRAAMVYTKKTAGVSPAAVCLVSAFAESCLKENVKKAEASVISEANLPSNMLILGCGGRVLRRYTRFFRKLL